MKETLKKIQKSSSLPRLQKSSMTQSKLFRNSQQLLQTKKLFLDRFESREIKNNNDDQNQKVVAPRSIIQVPKQLMTQGFVSFKAINKSESEQIFKELKNMRSKSTSLKPSIKAEIIINKNAHQKIKIANELKLKQQKEYIVKRLKQLTPTIMKREVKIKQKYKNKNRNVKKITLSLNYKLYESNLYCWKPYIDYDCLAVAINQQVFFIGGRKKTPIVKFNSMESKWYQLSSIPIVKCFGETDPSVVQNAVIFSFGGYDYFQQGFSMMTNTLKIIDIKKMTFDIQQFKQSKTPLRAFHSQCIYGKFLIVSGGVDKNNKLFSNFMNYNYQKKYWSQLTVQKMPEKLKLGFAKHQTLSVFHKRLHYSIYDNEPIIQTDQSIKEQGIYIFGGEDSNAELSSTMYIMRLGQPSIFIEKLQIEGLAPTARRNAKMIRHKDYIIIHGGKNDEMKPSILNSIHFLSLKNLNWIKVGGQKPPYRCSHALSVFRDQILILGGKSIQGLSKEVFLMPYEQAVEYI